MRDGARFHDAEALLDAGALAAHALASELGGPMRARHPGPRMQDANITKDALYEAVAPDDFEAMLALDRYNNRSTAFDKIIAATHAHFWDPLDTAYIDFDEPFDMENEPLLPEAMIAVLRTDYVSDRLSDPKTRTRFINQLALRHFSTILHGEQGALNLSASLCHEIGRAHV